MPCAVACCRITSLLCCRSARKGASASSSANGNCKSKSLLTPAPRFRLRTRTDKGNESSARAWSSSASCERSRFAIFCDPHEGEGRLESLGSFMRKAWEDLQQRERELRKEREKRLQQAEALKRSVPSVPCCTMPTASKPLQRKDVHILGPSRSSPQQDLS